MAAFRLLAFVGSALSVELLRGVGIVVFVAAVMIAFWRQSIWLLVIIVAGGAIGSSFLPEEAGGSGKVVHSLSNAPFVVLLYILLALGGYLSGRVARAMRGRS